ncbi:molecular chaperone DnaK [Salipiger aestuarii]|uniref:Putative chaperone protein n=1 Tax=Salipiger aestuarii TaxID=568098 RepID=A0A327XQE7_9RHOB|nr:Hsp70 family protein [Salipiger aestuarii]KAB2539869.1 molecular chaperone DnaK [Salipiger aestuarii]RAK11308.1 putative chaperone protein [Salipiger aestuarii]
MDRIAIDFGTSNSAAALAWDGGVHRIAIERGADTLPTAVFFPEGGRMRIGAAAFDALIAGEEGRYMRALKSVLGQPLLHEKRLVGGKRQTLADIVTAFLVELRERSEAATGLTFTRVLSGRPVHFHDDADRDAQAEADLRACYLAAGYTDVAFLPEPEAAARAAGGGAGIGLIVDIGGGTSDFSVYEASGQGLRILASHGIRLGGTDFDRDVSLSHAMPLLGLGSELRRDMGEGRLPVPHAPFVDLATWAKIPFLYNADARRMAADMARHAVEPDKLGRYAEVLENELGHGIAFAVEHGKIAANSDGAAASIALGEIERGLSAPITSQSLGDALADHRGALHAAAAETLARAGLARDAVQEVVLVGGSSLMGLVRDTARDLCPGAAQRRADAFTAVVDGLAITARDG